MKFSFCVIFAVIALKSFIQADTSRSLVVEGDEDIGEEITNVTMRWKDFSFKTLCDEDEWRAQFDSVKEQFTACLRLEKVIMPEEYESEEEMRRKDFLMTFSDPKSNPYCRVARNWNTCKHYLEGLNCIEPNVGPLEKKRASKIREMVIEKIGPKDLSIDPDSWEAMERPYKIICQVAKLQYGSSPFGPFGRGDNQIKSN